MHVLPCSYSVKVGKENKPYKKDIFFFIKVKNLVFAK